MRDRPLPVSKCAQPPFGIRTVAMMAPHCGQERVRLRVLSKELRPHGIQQALTNISLPDANCAFRGIRPPIPTASGHLNRSIRPPVARCVEA